MVLLGAPRGWCLGLPGRLCSGLPRPAPGSESPYTPSARFISRSPRGYDLRHELTASNYRLPEPAVQGE